MLAEKIVYIIRKYRYEVSDEIKEIVKILRNGQDFTDLFDGETFYNGLLNRMPRIKLATGFDAIISHELISEENSTKLNSLREKFYENWFDYVDLLSFVFESKLSITPEAMKQFLIRFKYIEVPLESIHKILEEILEALPEDENVFVDDSEFWEDYS
ncbi:MAG: hypothetical protein ACTSSK_10145 [Candidatus Heimdallarchaeota archaeon]